MVVLTLILAGYLLIECFLPLSTAVQIGGDEGLELAKATLCLKGYNLYTDIWNDQPPLHTYLVVETLKYISFSILSPRLISVGFAVMLLAATFLIFLRVSGLLIAGLATVLIVASPGFATLSSSCMLEIPALSLAVVALCILVCRPFDKWHLREVFAGLILGLSLQVKLIGLIIVPLFAFILWLERGEIRETAMGLILVGVSMVFTFIAVDWLIEHGAFLVHFQETWTSHFSAPRSVEYGSPQDHPFEWRMLARNWDAVIPAIVGIGFVAVRLRESKAVFFPLIWLALELLIFVNHKPWWSYYYPHISIPICWCAAIGVEGAGRYVRSKRIAVLLFGLFMVCALVWASARIYLQIREIRLSPQTYDSLILQEIKRYQPFANWLYADTKIYSFHSGIPMPPSLAVVMLKRMWSGEMTNARIAEEMNRYKPELVMLANDSRRMPFQGLMDAEYHLVYEDADFKLYALKAVIKKAQF